MGENKRKEKITPNPQNPKAENEEKIPRFPHHNPTIKIAFKVQVIIASFVRFLIMQISIPTKMADRDLSQNKHEWAITLQIPNHPFLIKILILNKCVLIRCDFGIFLAILLHLRANLGLFLTFLPHNFINRSVALPFLFYSSFDFIMHPTQGDFKIPVYQSNMRIHIWIPDKKTINQFILIQKKKFSSSKLIGFGPNLGISVLESLMEYRQIGFWRKRYSIAKSRKAKIGTKFDSNSVGKGLQINHRTDKSMANLFIPCLFFAIHIYSPILKIFINQYNPRQIYFHDNWYIFSLSKMILLWIIFHLNSNRWCEISSKQLCYSTIIRYAYYNFFSPKSLAAYFCSTISSFGNNQLIFIQKKISNCSLDFLPKIRSITIKIFGHKMKFFSIILIKRDYWKSYFTLMFIYDPLILITFFPVIFNSLFFNKRLKSLLLSLSFILKMASSNSYKTTVISLPTQTIKNATNYSPLANENEPNKNSDPIPPQSEPTFPSQTQIDANELTQTCLFGKMLGAPIELKTLMVKTKMDWKIVKGDVDYLEMGNGWILLRFANHVDKFMVWNERPWHVLGELLVLKEWKPFFDPYIEEVEWVDLWIRIPRCPKEMMNHESIAKLLDKNQVGQLIRLHERSLLRNKVRFVRACISVNINETLQSFAILKTETGKNYGYLIWYEDFSEGCSFCGAINHTIEECPTIRKPPKEIKIQIKRPPVLTNPYDNEVVMQDYAASKNEIYTVEAKAKLKSSRGNPGTTPNHPMDRMQKNKEPKRNASSIKINDGGNGLKSEKRNMVQQDNQTEAKEKGKAIFGFSSPIIPTIKPSNDASASMTNTQDKRGESSKLMNVHSINNISPLNEAIAKVVDETNNNLFFDFEKAINEKGSFLSDTDRFETGQSNHLFMDNGQAESGDSIVRKVKAIVVEQPTTTCSSNKIESKRKRAVIEMEDAADSNMLKKL